ncbi:hypothetical protein [Kribbella ginsengisoli]|uniref:Uncharacterized protein n=1 Tax=Kribbella ginsengisoli TaxID=363865 RepID=A0ABP6VY16_9ACTN
MPLKDALVLVLMMLTATLVVQHWRTVLQILLVLAMTGTCYMLLNIAEVLQS